MKLDGLFWWEFLLTSESSQGQTNQREQVIIPIAKTIQDKAVFMKSHQSVNRYDWKRIRVAYARAFLKYRDPHARLFYRRLNPPHRLPRAPQKRGPEVLSH